MSWATDHAYTTAEHITYNSVTYYPLTAWSIGPGITTGSGDEWLRAAVRFLIGDDSSSGSNHILAQYSAYTNDGSLHSNGYMLIRKLNSNITSSDNTAGVKTQGSFWSELNKNQRQGYVYNGVVTNKFIWYDTPYIVTDCGSSIPNDTTVTSKTFYVGTSEVVSGVYQQTSITSSCTSPGSGGTKPAMTNWPVEVGHGTDYTYTKWEDGWMDVSFNVPITGKTGTRSNNKYYADWTNLAIPATGVPAFTSVPYILLTVYSGSNLLTAQVLTMTSSKMNVRIWQSNYNNKIPNCTLKCTMKGKWKN